MMYLQEDIAWAAECAARYLPTKHDPYLPAWVYTYKLTRLDSRNTYPIEPLPPEADSCKVYVVIKQIVAKSRTHFERVTTHPSVTKALQTLGAPLDMHNLVLEAPRIATDGKRVAYYRNEQKMLAHDKDPDGNKHLTATTPQKYLTRHWPHVPSDRINKLVASLQNEYGFAETMEDMLHILEVTTATSCMSNEDGDWSIDNHPYNVYAPEFGWKLAYAKEDGTYIGRALVNTTDMTFVRTYGTTHTHLGLHQWLEDAGFSYEREWAEGLKFAKITYRGRFVAPYLDPGADRIPSEDCRRVRECEDYFVRDDSGEWIWDNTSGSPSEAETGPDCEDCGDTISDEDDARWVGLHSERCVCEHCYTHEYTYVIGRRGSGYVVSNDDVVEVNGDYYDINYLSNNDIVETADNRYTHIDYAIFVDDEYYHVDDIADDDSGTGSIVRVGDDYFVKDDCEWCIYNGEWVLKEDAQEVADGDYVKAEDFGNYILSLEREDVESNCLNDEEEEMLKMWDKYHDTATCDLFAEVA